PACAPPPGAVRRRARSLARDPRARPPALARHAAPGRGRRRLRARAPCRARAPAPGRRPLHRYRPGELLDGARQSLPRHQAPGAVLMTADKIAAPRQMRSVEFRKEREATWQALEALIATADKDGLRTLGAEQLARLPHLYRATLSSLSVARRISL